MSAEKYIHKSEKAPEELSSAALVEKRLAQVSTELRVSMEAISFVLDHRRNGELSEEDKADTEGALGELVRETSLAETWDALIFLKSRKEEIIAAVERVRTTPMTESQDTQHQFLVEGEQGKPLVSTPSSFGIHEPSITSILGKENLESIAQKPTLHTLLLGAMTRESANEFTDFSHTLNENSMPVALDMETRELQEADHTELRPLRADAAHLPLADDTQDLVFADYLLKFLREEGITSGKKIVEVFEETFRCLKPGGMFIMTDAAPVFDKASNTTSWLAVQLLSVTFRELGFTAYKAQPKKAYVNHVAKLRKDHSRVKQDRPHDSEWDEADPFGFTLLAQK